MLTFICGWRSAGRDMAVVNQRTPKRNAIFLVDEQSTVADLMPNAEIMDLWRNARLDIELPKAQDTLIRINYDTDYDLIQRAITRLLLSQTQSQIVVTYDAVQSLSQLFPALREVDALLAVNERFDAPSGDHIVFTRGGSYRWPDRDLEAQTVQLTHEETFDGGIVPEDIPDFNLAWN